MKRGTGVLQLLTTGCCGLAFLACVAWTHQAPDAAAASFERQAHRLEMAAALGRHVEPLRKESLARFGSHCATCHGPAGRGGVGPDLTDDEWRHGGDLLSIRDTIRLGVDGTAMPAWGDALSPRELLGMADHVANVLNAPTPDS